MGNLKSLEEISSDYGLIVIDTCAFHQILRRDSNPKSIKEKLENYLMKRKFLGFWKENIGHYENCYTISEVIEEMRNVRHYSYGKIIKKGGLRNRSPKVLELRRAIRDLDKERNRLVTYLEDKEKILELNKDEAYLYEIFYEECLEIRDNYDLHGADFPLFIFGAVTSQTRKSSAIISNDYGIVSAWSSFSEAEKISKEKFGFFVRKRISLFEKL